MKFVINKKKIIPDINEYFWIVLSSIVTVYLLKPFIIKLIPQIAEIHSFFQLMIWIFVIVYLKDLIIVKRNGRDLF